MPIRHGTGEFSESHEKWIGEIYEIDEGGNFNGWIGKQNDGEVERTVFFEIPINQIAEPVRHRVRRSALFFCDVELTEDEIADVKNITFIDQKPLDPAAIEESSGRWAHLAVTEESATPDD